MKYSNCTAETVGTIIKSLVSQDETPRLTVSFAVNGNEYVFSENITTKSETIKIGFLPVGQKKVWLVKSWRVGETVPVVYNPANPKEAHIKGNDGKYR